MLVVLLLLLSVLGTLVLLLLVVVGMVVMVVLIVDLTAEYAVGYDVQVEVELQLLGDVLQEIHSQAVAAVRPVLQHAMHAAHSTIILVYYRLHKNGTVVNLHVGFHSMCSILKVSLARRSIAQ